MRSAIATLIEFVICMMVPVIWVLAMAVLMIPGPDVLLAVIYIAIAFGTIPLASKAMEITYNWGRK